MACRGRELEQLLNISEGDYRRLGAFISSMTIVQSLRRRHMNDGLKRLIETLKASSLSPAYQNQAIQISTVIKLWRCIPLLKGRSVAFRLTCYWQA